MSYERCEKHGLTNCIACTLGKVGLGSFDDAPLPPPQSKMPLLPTVPEGLLDGPGKFVPPPDVPIEAQEALAEVVAVKVAEQERKETAARIEWLEEELEEPCVAAARRLAEADRDLKSTQEALNKARLEVDRLSLKLVERTTDRVVAKQELLKLLEEGGDDSTSTN